MTPDRVAEALAVLEAAEKGATPGRWSVEQAHGRDVTGEGWSRIDVAMGDEGGGCAMGDQEAAAEDAEFIARWRNAAPALLKLAKLVASHENYSAALRDADAEVCGYTFDAALAELAEAVLGP